jgi:hypothetical protein
MKANKTFEGTTAEVSDQIGNQVNSDESVSRKKYETDDN